MLKTIFNKKVIDQSNTDIYSTYWNHPPETWEFLFANDNPDRVMVRNILLNECCPSIVPTKTEENYGRIEFNRVDKFRDDLLDSPALTEEAQKNGLMYLLIVFALLFVILLPVLTKVPANLRNVIYPQTIELMQILEQEEQAKALKAQQLQSAQSNTSNKELQSAQNTASKSELHSSLSKSSADGAGATHQSYLSYLNNDINLGPKYTEHVYLYRDLDKSLEDYKNDLIAKTQPPKISESEKRAQELEAIPLSKALEDKPALVKTAARAILASQKAQLEKQKAAADPANHKHQDYGINKEFKPFNPLPPSLKLSSSDPFGTHQRVMEFKPLREALHFGPSQNRFKAPSIDMGNKAIHNKLDQNQLNAEVNRLDISENLASTQEENLGNELTNS
ncbi:hypothetical protein [Anaerobiospirillum succiniciproducens]|uniref:hypothetical protein n=1 Tax=Anaerobiospirillum succiniciproducens TaxID=13335 RepID=UPI000421B842|nr:hypothetical protein [Anaerobiospirillum succiniciproducens]